MKFLSLIAFFLIFHASSTMNAQVLGVKVGSNFGKFYDRFEDGGYESSYYKSQWGFHAGITLSELKIDTVFNLRFGLMYDEYGGDFNIQTGSHTSFTRDSGSLIKRSLGLQFYPVNLTLKGFSLGAGLQLNTQIGSTLTGKREGWSGFDTITTFDISLSASSFLRRYTVGALAYVNYGIKLHKGILGIEYTFNWNFTSEFSDYSIKSFRHQLSLFYNFYSFKTD